MEGLMYSREFRRYYATTDLYAMRRFMKASRAFRMAIRRTWQWIKTELFGGGDERL